MTDCLAIAASISVAWTGVFSFWCYLGLHNVKFDDDKGEAA